MDSVKAAISIALVGGIALMFAFAANAAKIDDDIAIEQLLASRCGRACGALVSHAAIGDSPTEPVSVFGLQLHRPLSLRECKVGHSPRIPGLPASPNYYHYVTAPCFKRENEADISTKKPLDNDDYIIGEWPSATLPKLVCCDKIYIGTVDGNIESVQFKTSGVSSQQTDLDALKAKFGEPSSLETPVCQNEFGATSRAITAGWHVGQVLIYFHSCPYGPKYGTVDVRTQKWTDHARQNYEESQASKKQRAAF